MTEAPAGNRNESDSGLRDARGRLRSAVLEGAWGDIARSACTQLIAEIRANGKGDIVIAEELIASGIDERQAWLMLGFLDVPRVASARDRRRVLRSHGLTFGVALAFAIGSCCWPDLMKPVSAGLAAAVVAVMVVYDYILLELRRKRAAPL